MRDLTKIMIEKYILNQLKYDFAGFYYTQDNQLSFHHLIIPHRKCKELGLGEGYYEWNGAILRQDTSHDYLHTIERYDLDRFNAITSEMIDENIKGYLDMENLKAIEDILTSFENEYFSQTNKNGKYIIKEKYYNRILKKGR